MSGEDPVIPRRAREVEGHDDDTRDWRSSHPPSLRTALEGDEPEEAVAVAVREAVAATPNARLNAQWNGYGDEGGHWTGADGTTSLQLPDGRIVWLFSDTFLGVVTPEHSRPRDTPFIRNSLVVQQGQTLTTLTGGTPAQPKSLVEPPPGAGTSERWCWVGDGTVDSNTLLVFYNTYRRTGPGSLDFELTGTCRATFSLPDLVLRGVVELPGGERVAWGACVLEQADYTYIYGSEPNDLARGAHVARARPGAASAPWEYWTGSGWSPNEQDSTRLLTGVGTAFSVDRHNGRYVLVSQDTHVPFSPNIVAFFAESPTGPFTEPLYVYRAPEARDQHIIYDARLHPELSEPGKLLISYNVNSLSLEEVHQDARIYRPRFIDVTLPSAPTGSTTVRPPTRLRGTPGDGSAHLEWDAPAEGAAYWVYQRDVTAGQTGFGRLPLPITDGTSMSAGFLANQHEYEFKVTAFSDAGESAPSNGVRVLSQVPAPAAPVNLRATPGAAGEIALEWEAPEGAPGWYWVYQRDVTAGEAEFSQLPLPISQGTSMSAGNLSHAHVYEFRVTADSSGGEGPPSNTAQATSHYPPPGPPLDLRGVPGDGEVRLTWAEPAPDVWYWVYQRDVTDEEPTFTRLPLPVSSGTTLTAGYLQNGHDYEFKVTAIYPGGEGPASNVARARPLPARPTVPGGLKASPRPDGQISLTWTAPSASLYYWVYQRDVTARQSAFTRLGWPTQQLSAMLGALSHGHTYEFKVNAENLAGEGPSTPPVRAIAQYAPPAAPTDLRARAGDGEVELLWDAPAPRLAYWVYQRDVTASGSSFSKLPLQLMDTSATLGLLRNGHAYEFKVSATNPGGEGPASSPVRVVARGGLPAAPTQLKVQASNGAARLSWHASATPGVAYKVYQRDVSSGQSFRALPLPIRATSLTAGLLVNGRTYEFRVVAVNVAGESKATNVARVRPLPPIPAAPTGLSAKPGDGKALLRWKASSTPGVSYWVFTRDETTGQAWKKLPIPLSGTAMTAGYLYNGHTYQFLIKATNVAGDSAGSNVASARPMPPLPAAPSNLRAVEGDRKITLSWSASPTQPVFYWVFQRNATRKEGWRKLGYPLTRLSVPLLLMTNDETYQFVVKADNIAGSSGSSNIATATPYSQSPAVYQSILNYLTAEMVRNPVSRIGQAILTANRTSKVAYDLPWLPLLVAFGLPGKVLAAYLWITMVAPGKPWDHKPQLQRMHKMVLAGSNDNKRWTRIQDSEKQALFYDVWSNIHFGYVGRALGFSTNELQGGQMLASMASDLMGGQRDLQKVFARAFDEGDILAINLGIHLYAMHKPSSLRAADVHREMLLALHRFPPAKVKPWVRGML
jgi:hypothetical protein